MEDLKTDNLITPQYCYITPTSPRPMTIQFMDSDNRTVVGKLAVVDGELRFTGNADEAAKVFFDHVLKRVCDEYISGVLAGKTEAKEAEADESLRLGHYQTFASMDELIDALEPSARVIAAINELESGGGERFDSVDDLFASLEDDDDPMVQIGKDEFDRFVVSDNVLLVYGYGATKRLAIIDYLTALIEYLRIVEQDTVEDEAENALLIESGVLPKLIASALQTKPSDDWRSELTKVCNE